MILNTGDKKLKVIREVQKNEVSEVYICKEIENNIKTYHTLWMVKDRELAKKMLEYEQCSCFCVGETVCFLLPYEEPRPIQDYFIGVIGDNPGLEDGIYRACVVCCMASKISYPILYLMLKQGQLYLSKDGSIHFGYLLDLQKMSFDITEADCAIACAELICRLYQTSRKAKNKMAIRLLEQKCSNRSYYDFMGLLSDVRMFTGESVKKNYIGQWKEEIVSRKDKLFRILCMISIIMIVIVLIVFLMDLFLGDTALYRLFAPAIERIGTESLLQ